MGVRSGTKDNLNVLTIFICIYASKMTIKQGGAIKYKDKHLKLHLTSSITAKNAKKCTCVFAIAAMMPVWLKSTFNTESDLVWNERVCVISYFTKLCE